MVSLPKFFQQSSPVLKLLIAAFILAIAAVPILPNYVTHNWSWYNPPDVPALHQLETLQTTGITVPGWQIRDHQVVEISGKKWSIQALSAPVGQAPAVEQPPMILLLRPQTWHRDQPQVEWMDIKGTQHWTIDRMQRLQFRVPVSSETTGADRSIAVTARFFRGWNAEQTYAVLQWYAWSNGGSPAPSHWFWADQLRQWTSRQRMPWVAVSLLIPIEPLREIEPVRSLAESLGQAIQSELMVSALNTSS